LDSTLEKDITTVVNGTIQVAPMAGSQAKNPSRRHCPHFLQFQFFEKF
jgi:hypothetical protein